jgi:hypothetical protein
VIGDERDRAINLGLAPIDIGLDRGEGRAGTVIAAEAAAQAQAAARYGPGGWCGLRRLKHHFRDVRGLNITLFEGG